MLVVTGRYRPHQILLLAYSLAAGVLMATGLAPVPPLIVGALWPWVVNIWVGLWIGSGAAGLAGVLWRGRDRDTGMRLEAGGMLLNTAPLCVQVGVILPYASGAVSITSVCLIVAWAVANLARAEQVRRDLRSYHTERGASP